MMERKCGQLLESLVKGTYITSTPSYSGVLILTVAITSLDNNDILDNIITRPNNNNTPGYILYFVLIALV